MKRFFLVVFFVLAAGIGSAAITVDIVDYPTRVLVYSPMLVTVRVVNHGPDPELMPANVLIKIGSTPDKLSWYSPVKSSGGSVIWLEPGDAWLFQVDLGRFWTHKPGQIYVVAGMQSDGKCLHLATGAEAFPLKLVHETGTRKLYECWSGTVFSDEAVIAIELPSAPMDIEALEFFEGKNFLGGIPAAGVWAGSDLLMERFPTSEVTYAIGLQHCKKNPSCLQELLDHQPLHPLRSHARFRLAMALLETGHESRAKDIDLPEGLKQYFLQEVRKSKAGGGGL